MFLLSYFCSVDALSSSCLSDSTVDPATNPPPLTTFNSASLSFLNCSKLTSFIILFFSKLISQSFNTLDSHWYLFANIYFQFTLEVSSKSMVLFFVCFALPKL